MKKLTAGILTGAAVATLGAAAASVAVYTSTKYLLQVALDRQIPYIPLVDKAARQLKGYDGCREMLEAMDAGAERLETSPHRRIRIQSYDGQALVGHWFPVKTPKRVIIAMHGWRSSWSGDFGLIAPFWENNDCSVLYAEQRGQGSSGGAYIGFGMLERRDCLEWAKWVCSHYSSSLPIYLAGVSMGASTVLMASDLELPKNVRGILADCGFTSAHDIFEHVAQNNLHLNYGLRSAAADRLCRQKLHLGTRDCSCPSALKNAKIPVLFIHGASDHFVPVQMTYENYLACNAPKELLIVPGADHGMSYFTEKDKYENQVLRFWQDLE